MCAALALAALIACATADIPADLITSLPGWAGELPSKQYSGYLPVTDGFLHYWFIESQNNPSTDPVLLWLNGGPGSSSLIGLLTENGQLQTNDNSLNDEITPGVPNLIYNPWNWSLNHSIIYLESPKGVGFSYCTKYPCNNNDQSQAEDVYTFLTEFFAAFSEYAANDFYITGESYAGIYIPLIMQQIDEGNSSINLKGAAIGDGCWGNDVGTCGFANEAMDIAVQFYNGHAMFPQSYYTAVMAACGNFTVLSAECNTLLNKLDDYIGNFYIYNIYDTCGNDQVEPPTHAQIFEKLREKTFSISNHNDSFAIHPQLNGVGGLNGYPCGAETVMSEWLNIPAVMAALHVQANNKGMQYTKTAGNLLPLYAKLIAKYRILIYSGDVDACVPFVGTEQWTSSLNYKVVEDWHPWTALSTGLNPTQVKAGYVTRYGGANATEFYFLTVNGAGHMVPQFQPIPASVMITKFIAGEKF